jgi:phage protein D
VDEVEHGGPPDAITIRARSADIAASLKEQHTKGWHQVTLGDIVTTVAKRHHLTPACAEALAGTTIAHIDQTDESDAHLLTRLAQQYDAIATVKGSTSEEKARLLFIPRGGGKTAGGTALPSVTLNRSDGDTHRYSKAERSAKTTGVRARWYARDAARAYSVLAGEEGTVKALRKTYPTEQEAWQAANAELNKLARGGATMAITLAVANLELMPEVPVNLRGWKQTICDQSWIISGPVVHKLEGALTTSLQLALAKQA